MNSSRQIPHGNHSEEIEKDEREINESTRKNLEELGIELNIIVCYDLRCWEIWISGTIFLLERKTLLKQDPGSVRVKKRENVASS